MPVRFVIDYLDFVRNTKVLRGKIRPVEFTRLHSYLFDDEGEFFYVVSGFYDANKKPSLRIVIKGKISLHCQRCLGKLVQPLDLQTNLLLAKNENELHQYDQDDAINCILASPDMDVMMLIEDEIILNLSISLSHQKSECTLGSMIIDNQQSSEHPFAALATLKKTH